MNDRIIDSIASDLGIIRLKGDLDKSKYHSAVIYSAAALWAKTATQDTSESVETGLRKHVLNVCAKFLESALDRELPDVISYFNPPDFNTDKSASVKLVDTLVRTRELSQTGFGDRQILSLPPDRFLRVGEKLQVIQGKLDGEYLQMSGLSYIYETDETTEYPEVPDNAEWVKNRLDSFERLKPNRTEESPRDRYFDIDQYPKNRFQRNRPHPDYPFEVVMNEVVGGKEIYLIRTKKGFYRLDDFSVELKEHYRFMIYLWSRFGQNSYTLEEKENTLFVRGRHALPIYEDALLRTVLWPDSDISDTAHFFGPKELKPFVVKILSHLGLVI